MMDRIQLIKMLSWNISVDPEIDIDKVIDKLKEFPNRPRSLISELEETRLKGTSSVDKTEMIKKLERL